MLQEMRSGSCRLQGSRVPCGAANTLLPGVFWSIKLTRAEPPPHTAITAASSGAGAGTLRSVDTVSCRNHFADAHTHGFRVCVRVPRGSRTWFGLETVPEWILQDFIVFATRITELKGNVAVVPGQRKQKRTRTQDILTERSLEPAGFPQQPRSLHS